MWSVLLLERCPCAILDMAASTSSSSVAPTCVSSDCDSESEVEDTSSSIGSKTTPEPVSLLSRLKSPTPSDLSRKRKIASNPPKGKRRSRGDTGNDPKNIYPHQRIKEFSGEPLKVNLNKKLFCCACREELSLKLSSLRNHFQSTKHIDGKKRLEKKEAREKDIVEALKVYWTVYFAFVDKMTEFFNGILKE